MPIIANHNCCDQPASLVANQKPTIFIGLFARNITIRVVLWPRQTAFLPQRHNSLGMIFMKL